MDIKAWLAALGLQRYEQAFRDHDIDFDVLPELTADDLSALGITSVGHRRKLLAATATLRIELAQASEGNKFEEGPAPTTHSSRSSTHAERRQLTVMFVDLVGSTERSRSFRSRVQDRGRAWPARSGGIRAAYST